MWHSSRAILLCALLFVICMTALTWFAVVREDRRGLLTVSFLDVGQGDAIFIDAPSGRQVLIDGGPDTKVLRSLSRAMPWYDRSIDVVIPTHPDLDHIGGLIDVLARYKVATILHSSVDGDTAAAKAMVMAIQEEGAQNFVAVRGQMLDLGRGVRIEVLSPDRALPQADTNTACTVVRLVYGKTSFMLSCDAPQAMEEYLVSLDGASLKSDVLKAGHHGSKTSSSLMFVGFVDPAYAVYSRGCGNTYGFPHKETVATFARFGIPTLDTCEEGTITFVSDGSSVRLK